MATDTVVEDVETEPVGRQIPATPEWLRAGVQQSQGSQVGVDRENNIVLGYVVAQEGPFKDLRGEFDKKSLTSVVKLMRQNRTGTKVRFGHPSLSDDGLSKFLGRAKNPRMDTVTVERDGNIESLIAVRADLHLSDTAMMVSESGFSLGEYVMSRAEEDPDSFGSSLVLKADQEMRLGKDRRPLRGEDGEELPTLWRPTVIHGSDVVDNGDAVDGFLSVELGLPDQLLRQGHELFLGFLPGQSREVVETRLLSWLSKALDDRFGSLVDDMIDEDEDEDDGLPDAEFLRRRIRLRDRDAI